MKKNQDRLFSSLHDLTETERSLVEFAQQLVQTPSLPREEQSVAKLIADQLIQLGYRDVEIDANGNVIGIFGEGEPKLMFNGHMDHVPVAGMQDPYNGEIVDGSRWNESGLALRGRGSCDMKANVAAGAFAPVFLKEMGKSIQHSYLFTADVCEEIDGFEGIPSILSRGIRAEYGISGESTSLNVAVGHRGKIQFDVIVEGRSCHAATPNKGINAVNRAIPILQAIEEYHQQLPQDPLYGSATITVTGIHSKPEGEVAVVPSSCIIRIDRRYIPSESPDSCQKELEELVANVSNKHRISAKVKRVNVYPLMQIDKDHRLVAEAISAVESVIGKKPSVMTWQFGVNATFMSEAGIPSIGIGPGNEKYAHTPEEHVPLLELIQASKIYAELIHRICNDPKNQ